MCLLVSSFCSLALDNYLPVITLNTKMCFENDVFPDLHERDNVLRVDPCPHGNAKKSETAVAS